MSIGKINASLAGGLTQETTLALANLNFDFSLCKVEAPMEYQGLGECLSKRRRAAAESGNEHRMARKLGALFSHTLPATPNLVRAYGKRATEIIRESSKRESSSKRNDGVFGEWTGPDATSIWAAATSGAGAIAAHLLACMLARMWTASEAAAVWEEIIESRKLEIANSDPGTPLWQSQELAAKVETTREQISMWDSSARSWLEIADKSRMKQQKQLMLLVDNAGIPVNQASTTYRSVMDAWTTALSTIEKLLEGVSQSINNGGVILALTSWHIFPDMFVVGAGPNIIQQNDSLYPKGTVITLGQSPPGASGEVEQIQIREQALTVEHQESYPARPPVATDTAEPYTHTILSSDLSLGSSKPTQIFSAGHSVLTDHTALSKAGINDENPHSSRFDDTATNYTSPWKEHPHSKALIRGLAQHLNEEAKSFSRDESVLDRISVALPDLVRAFALRLGYSPRTTDDRDVALFLRRNRL